METKTHFFHSTSERIEKLKMHIFNFFRESPKGWAELNYIEQIKECLAGQKFMMELNCKHLFDFDPKLLTLLTTFPMEFIPIVDSTIRDITRSLANTETGSLQPIFVRPFNTRVIRPLRGLDLHDIERLVSVRGIISRVLPVYPELKFSLFICQLCGEEKTIFSYHGTVNQPVDCPKCKKKFTMKLIHNKCRFANKQQITLQETPEAVPPGESPYSVTMHAYDDLVDIAKKGSRVEVVGIYRIVPYRLKSSSRLTKTTYKTYLDLVHIRSLNKDEKRSLNIFQDCLPCMMGEHKHTRELELRSLAEDGNIYERLAQSIAPSILGHIDVKKGILCQLFGGVAKNIDYWSTKGNINIILIGDPGVSKSKFLEFVYKLIPRCVYTSGRAASAAGLTALVRRDINSKAMILEPGALVLSEGGICCIDEFDKMAQSSHSALYQVMDEQSISIAKGGLLCNLSAKVAILASSNPIGSRYNDRMTVLENIQLPPTVLSRFDLIFLMVDRRDVCYDKELARHLVSFFWEHPPHCSAKIIDLNTLRDYIAYSKATCIPRMSDRASFLLVKGYINSRENINCAFFITPRYLESLIRLSEALARINLCEVVTPKHAHEALRLCCSTLFGTAVNLENSLVQVNI
eukprot:gnl/MRDRNA2_/MRDRNA2_85569_c0_seq1.p1 gnl/MRDRNA2_/MRDRNA2_85569_c0~~gnl/MRDRNA2_/MRDRNA2_85569_c0_seq1.p1  ORF type:complete len:649 (-),score=-12.69 gnl/MRDRNA2_/MRDRNA2_85569_c0_seq1:53-1948(-)